MQIAQIMQGDQYGLLFKVTVDKQPATADAFDDLEITVGPLSKRMSTGEITYDPSLQGFVFSLTQEESFGLRGLKQVQLRPKFADTGYVRGVDLGQVEIVTSLSTEVL